MDTHDSAPAKILIATDSVTDAGLVKNLLHPEFDQVFLSTDPAHAVSDFDQHRPDVLVLAFTELEKSERYYLGLYRLSQVVHLHPHRTIILCTKENVKRVYELCMKDYFDDYVLFWPMTFDASRLLISIHNGVRDLAAIKTNAPSVAEFAAQARCLAELEDKLDQQVAQGVRHIEASNRAMEQAEQGIGSALDDFSQRITEETRPAALKNEINRFKQEEIHQHFHAAADSNQSLMQWAKKLEQECEPQIESARALNAMAERIRPVVLVVDDDEFQRKIIGKLLDAEKYRLIFAFNGFQALGVLRKTKPDVILMDVIMPEMDGMEVTRRLRKVGQFTKTPVIMITGNSEEKVVRECLKVGATDFVVKPFDRAILIDKIKRALAATASSMPQ